MPFASEKKLIPRELDRRVKLTDAERSEIVRLGPTMSQRALAKAFGVSRRLITFILDPEKLKQNVERRAERGGSKQYYDRAHHATAMRMHRRHKHGLDLAGKLDQK